MDKYFHMPVEESTKSKFNFSRFFKNSLSAVSVILFVCALGLGAYGWWWKINQPAVPEDKEALMRAEQVDLLKKLGSEGLTNQLSASQSVQILKTLQADESVSSASTSADEQLKLLQTLQ